MRRNVFYSFLILLTLFISQQAHSDEFKIVTLEGSKSIKIGNSRFEENGSFNGDDTIFWNANHKQSLYVTSHNWKGVISYDRFKQTHSARLNHYIAALNRVSLVNTKSGSSLGREYDFKLMFSTAEGFEQKRLALVIGNENYKDEHDNLSVLLFGLCDSLRACGFDVLYLRDCNEELTKKSFEYISKELNKKTNHYKTFLFYYEGHGLINKQNIDCIVPTDERSNNYGSKKLMSFRDMAKYVRTNVPKFFIINACRDSRSLDGAVFSPECANTCFFFSTAAGKTAKAGAEGANSKFTECFASAIMQRDVPFNKIVSKIQEEMMSIEQNPIPYGCLPMHNNFVFHPSEIDVERMGYVINVANNLYQNAKSKFLVDAKSEAKALCLQAQDSLKSIKRLAGSNDGIVNVGYRLLNDSLNVLIGQCDNTKSLAQNTNKIRGLVSIAENAESQGDMGTALRNYYGAQLKLRTLPQEYRDAGLYASLTERLNHITKGITVRYEKDPFDDTQAKLYFYWPDGRRATNVPFKIDNVDDNGQTTSSVDGSAYVTLPIGCKMEDLSVSVDVDDVSSWGDAEMRRMVSKNPSGLSVKCKPSLLEKNASEMVPSMDRLVGSMSNNTSDKVANAKYYDEVIAKVCNGISTQDEESIRQHFTENGFDLLQKLMAKKYVRIDNANSYKLLSYYGEVYARSIRMSLRFPKGKKITEDVVFVFNSDKKIDGIQYALDDGTSRQIEAMDLSDILKYAIVNLIENYRTAYSLQNKEYIESVFSDDAVIIVGRVVDKARIKDSRETDLVQNVEFLNLNKEEYLKRLERQFKSKEWINLKFATPTITKAKDGRTGIGLWQEYSSSNYSDKGYLFLIVRWENDKPVILLRAWHPQDKFGFPEYEELLRQVNGSRK